MAGHSKWHNIQRTKGAQDAKRAKIFTKIAREITVAVKEGSSGDPANNTRLAAAVAKAKAYNMPNDNIKRTIDKALGSGGLESFDSVTYEGYGPGGVAVIVEAMTNNRNRTASEIRLLYDKYGGNMGTPGCVSWSFSRKGVIIIDNEDRNYDEDTVFEDALEAGADDIITNEDVYEVYTLADDFADVSGVLEAAGYKFVHAQIELVPQSYISLSEELDIKNIEKMLDLMEDNDDVQNVWHNYEKNEE
ncbi:MAG: YebC/PmpR family DNA-binding transcriptional regulator [Oscillospiraceae bacterium]|nr:YebC/PmpR family DNA-binding transcriptional regulator [Oscillospiraceae bacterium]